MASQETNMIHGVVKSGGSGISKCIEQKEARVKLEQ